MSMTLAMVLDSMIPTIKCVAELIDSKIDMKHLKDGTTRIVWTLRVSPKRNLAAVQNDHKTSNDQTKADELLGIVLDNE